MSGDRRPILVGLSMSPTFAQGLNRATELLHLAYPEASDAELLERIFVAGICACIDQFTTLRGARPRFDKDKP